MPMPVRSASAAGKRSARAPGREPGLIMSILIGAILLVTLSGCQTANAAAACTPGDPMRAGHYYLNGLMEVGSELLLNNDGSFEFMLAYGALDQYGKGCWRVEGNKLLVIPEGRSAPAAQYSIDDSSFVGFTLAIEGGELIWDIGGGTRGRYARS